MTQVTQKNNDVYDPSKLEPYLKLNPDTKNSILYSLCGAITDTEKGYIRKKKSRILEGFNGDESSNNAIDSKKSKVYTKKVKKDIFHDLPDDTNIRRSYSRFYDQLASYYSLPLFIFSKIYSEAVKTYGREEDSQYHWEFSFYTAYMNIVERVCNGEYEEELFDYHLNVEQNYGNTYCQQYYSKDFIKEELERKTFTTESEGKEKIDKYIKEDHTPEQVKSYREIVKSMIVEGSWDADYEVEKNAISHDISLAIDFVNELEEIDKPSFKDFQLLRSKILFYIYFDLDEFNVYMFRKPELMKNDIKKIVIEYNRFNRDKKDFVKLVNCVNQASISYFWDLMTVIIDREGYIDYGMHGEEYLGVQEITEEVNGEWVVKEYYIDTIKIE